MPIDNEILSPVPIWIWVDPKTKLKHLTGGYGQPDMKKCLCSKKITTQTVVDVRDVVPYKEGKDYQQYCLKCLNMLRYEALEYKIYFAAVNTPVKGKTLGSEIIAGQLTRRSPPTELNQAPAKPKTAKIKDVAGSPPPKKYKHRLQSSIKPKKPKSTKSQMPKKRKTRSDKGVKRGPRTPAEPKVDKGSNITETHGEKSAKEIVGGRRDKRSRPSVEESP